MLVCASEIIVNIVTLETMYDMKIMLYFYQTERALYVSIHHETFTLTTE